MSTGGDDPAARLDRLCAVLGPARPSGDRRALRCPAHDDQHESLTAKIGTQGHILLVCHAGCAFAAIEAAAIARGLDRSVLYPSARSREVRVEATYAYHDEHGTHVFTKVRFVNGGRSGRFAFQAPDGSFGLKGISARPLYRLPAVLAGLA
ncbi:MAG: putative primase/helicase, partial [Mycobacterium sp.]|nr:putative primase/helicase [Mycobacterium sp.]